MGAFAYIIDAFDVTVTLCFQNALGSLSKAVKPANMGVGIWARQQANAEANLKSASSTVGKALIVATVALDVTVGIYDNVQCGASVKKIAWDAGVDAVYSTGKTLACVKVGAAIGSLIPVPVVGTLVGAAAGYGASLLIDTCFSSTKKWIKGLFR